MLEEERNVQNAFRLHLSTFFFITHDPSAILLWEASPFVELDRAMNGIEDSYLYYCIIKVFLTTLYTPCINWNLVFRQDLSKPSVLQIIVHFEQNKNQMEKPDTWILSKQQERKSRLLLCCRLIRGDSACWQQTISEFKSKLLWKKRGGGIPSGHGKVICLSSGPLRQAAGRDESLNLPGCGQKWQRV